MAAHHAEGAGVTGIGRAVGDLTITVLAIVAATLSGAQLFAMATAAQSDYQQLLLSVGIPAFGLLVLVTVLALLLRWRRPSRAIVVGAAAGAVATVPLEAVRITGFRVFGSMPGDLPTLIGMRAADRMMAGPSTWSTLLGYTDHFWNGAAFGIIYALLLGGFPHRWRAWSGAVLGGGYGVVLGIGFATGPVPLALGVGGVFGTVSVVAFHTTVYLAHLAFGLTLGALVHRFGKDLAPAWSPVLTVLRRIRLSGG
ncbi:hypothetical protein [Haloechinothrix sp. LS1_15]|uniref:hypothetical protein n=1 Tax=Haloechinothrix sp. LS1_15 TaxID=2652248 RepID=UPI002947C2B9|nr:hypothetical protein [Haloechinothrix sp. LS1_15]MDV6013625.1 hypothetical protein [Haloechinothrix sp. LS1_15]